MFKYLWIIILIIFACAFIGYTIYVAYKSFKEASEEETVLFRHNICTILALILRKMFRQGGKRPITA